MSSQTASTNTDDLHLSEKLLRLLAAHDREVADFEKERARNTAPKLSLVKSD